MSEGRAGIAIAVDGPAASGKGTAARALARALGYAFIDTGAMYRAVALVARRAGVSWDAEAELGRLAQDLDFAWRWDGEGLRLSVRGEDVTEALRDGEIGTGASRVSRHPAVRAALLEAQRAAARRGGVVMDGRDIGTVVLPDAELKVYLDAGLDERARRRHAELVVRGEGVTLAEVREALAARDALDSGRATAPLRAADDAVVVDTTHLSPEEVRAALLQLAFARGAS
jgi:cytidylate kinase